MYMKDCRSEEEYRKAADYLYEKRRDEQLAESAHINQVRNGWTHDRIVNLAYGMGWTIQESDNMRTITLWSKNGVLMSKYKGKNDGFYRRLALRFSAMVGDFCMGTTIQLSATRAFHILTEQMDIPFFELWAENNYSMDIVG